MCKNGKLPHKGPSVWFVLVYVITIYDLFVTYVPIIVGSKDALWTIVDKGLL